MAYSRASASWVTLNNPLDAYLATLPENKQLQLRNARPFLARFLTVKCAGLPSLDTVSSVDAWLAMVPVSVLKDPRRLIDELSDPQLAATLQYDQDSVRHYRHHVKGFLQWYRNALAEERRSDPVTEAWEHLIDQVKEVVPPQKVGQARHHLRKLAAHATRAGLGPGQIDTAFTAQERAYLFKDSGLRNPHTHYAGARGIWGLLADAGIVHRVDFYQPPKKPQVRIRPEQLPLLYQQELQEIERCLRSEDPDEWLTRNPRRTRPVSEAMVDNCLHALHEFLGALVFDHHLDLNPLPFYALFADSHYLALWGDSMVARAGDRLMAWHQDKLRLICSLAEVYIPRRWPEATVDLGDFRHWVNQQEGEKKPRRPGYVPPEQVEVVLADLERQIDHLIHRQPPASPATLLPKLRDHFMIAFLLENALRSGNLREAQIGQQVVEHPHGVRCMFPTKNGKKVPVFLTPRVLRSYQAYMDPRRELGFDAPNLLVSNTGKPLSSAQIWQQVTRVFKRVLNIHYTPHDFRRTLSSRILLETGDVDLAMLLIADGTPEILRFHYDVVEPEVGFALWQAHLHAVEHQLPTAWAPAVQHFVTRAQDPQEHQQLLALMTEMRPPPSPSTHKRCP